jgi:hypothetical protein
MQTNLAVADGAITGTLKYLSTGSIPAVWGEGNFMALKFESDISPENIKVGLEPSVSSGLVALDEDMNGVFKVTDKDAQVFVVESFDGAVWSRATYDLSGLTLQDS